MLGMLQVQLFRFYKFRVRSRSKQMIDKRFTADLERQKTSKLT
jgi:hypothetical protein